MRQVPKKVELEMREDIAARFYASTDDTGRFTVHSRRTGKTYAVEPIIGAHTPKWGSIDPATNKLVNKKGAGKHLGGINATESLISEENGFASVKLLGVGVSPLHEIALMDAKYPDKE